MRAYAFNVTPVGKPRQTQRDKWMKRPAVMRYRAFADELRAAAKAQGFVFPESGAKITFFIPMPDSWSAKKKDAMAGVAHRQKPDIDNLMKAVLDSLLPDDSAVWNIAGVTKVWARFGRIVLEVE